MTRWKRLSTYGAFLIVWALFTVWQWYEYGRSAQLAREVLHRQAHSVMDALGGGVRSHRRLGFFFANQLHGVLEALVQSPDILAVAIVTEDGRTVLSAGATAQLEIQAPLVVGDAWLPGGFQLLEPFALDASAGGPGPSPRGRRGWGWLESGPDGREALPADGRFVAALLLDRAGTDQLCRRSAWLHTLVVLGGGLVAVCAALAWRSAMRLAEAQGQTRVLEAETRHLRELGQAAAGLAHDTRNPLGLVRGCTQRLAQSGRLTTEQRQQTEAVVEECDRLTARINQFLAFARPRSPALEPVDPDALIGQLVALIQPDLDAKDLRIRHTPCQRPVVVDADPEMLRQALFNLVQNAIHFSPRGEVVDIAVHDGEDGGYCIQVADRGPGVPPGSVDSLFTPYFTTRSGGTGLGLAIVRRIATAHGWHVAYRPRDDGGSIFQLGGGARVRG